MTARPPGHRAAPGHGPVRARPVPTGPAGLARPDPAGRRTPDHPPWRL